MLSLALLALLAAAAPDIPNAQPFSLAADIVPGSALDASFLLDPPAGRHGFVHADGERLAFADGTPARFYGVNLCWEALFPTAEQADAVAERLARSGVNVVRLTYLDSFAPRGLIDPDRPDTATIHPEQAERLDRFVAALKQRGIYCLVALSMGQNTVRPGDGFPAADTWTDEQRAAVEGVARFFDPAMQALDRRRMAAILDRVNPHTGVRWADEPAFMSFELLNERSIYYHYADIARLPAELQEALRARFNTWLAAQYADDAALRAAWGEALGDSERLGTVALDLELPQNPAWRKDPGAREARANDWNRFLAELQAQTFDALTQHLRDLGVQAPIAPTGGGAFVAADQYTHRGARPFYQHSYFDHPIWTAAGPLVYTNESALQRGLSLTRSLSLSRLAGQPYGASEYDYCFPNDWRAEGGPALTAYGAFQGWSLMTRFAYWASDWSEREAYFSDGEPAQRGVRSIWRIMNDPAGFGPWPAWACLFLRGDVRPAERRVDIGFSRTDALWRERYRWPPAYLDFLADAPLQHAVGRAYFDDRYTGDADLVVASGRSTGGDYTAARRAVLHSANPWGDLAGRTPGLFTCGESGVLVETDDTEQAGWLARAVTDRWGADTGLLPPPDQGWIVSDTGELRLRPDPGLLTIHTPASRGVVGFGAGRWALGGLTLDIATDFATVLVTSLDGQPLEQSARLLVCAVGRCQNEGFERRPADGGKYQATGGSLGSGPTYIEPIRFALALDGAPFTVHALDGGGRRLGQVDPARLGEGPVTIFYELVR